MQREALIFVLACTAAQGQSLLQTIDTPEKAIRTSHQTLVGTWLMELRRPNAPAGQAPTPNLTTYLPDGTIVATTADGAQTTGHGVWVRVGDRKFLKTIYTFNFGENRALVTISKVRVNIEIDLDGRTAKGTTEVVIIDREGRVMATLGGGQFSGNRLAAERPGDFEAFQVQ